MLMEKSLLHREVVPFLLMFALLIVATMIGDYVMHYFDLVWIGRYLGIPGTVIVLLSLIYSLRKRKLIRSGNPRILLSLHELLTLLGSWMILVHAGIHFNSILPWLALGAMVINVVSGLTGKFILERSRRHMAALKEQHKLRGMSKDEIDREVFWDAVTVDMMAKWRKVHFPITLVFAVLTLGHIISIFLFWNWR
jgi:hypothetical protein